MRFGRHVAARAQARPTRLIRSDTVQLRTSYDAEGNRLTVTRGYTARVDTTDGGLYELGSSTWEYDALNRVTQHGNAGGGLTTWTQPGTPPRPSRHVAPRSWRPTMRSTA